MAAFIKEEVLSVHHWDDNLFSFKTSRASSLRFKNGHFIMIGLEVEGRPLMRAYSIASANHEDHLEFFSIKVPDGPLTSRLQSIKPGDELMLSSKPTGTLINDHLLPGKNLYLISTGTGLAPFLSIIRDPDIYEQYDKVILTHGVRYTSELAYQELILEELPNHEYFGDLIRDKLVYYPSVTREAYKNQGRLTDLMVSGQLFKDLNLPAFNLETDRFMICGGPSMLKETCEILNERGFKEAKNSEAGHYVIERAFVES
ncbi:ferredoxin--NADP reductase [Oceanospirillum maris]|uniref:ferredoxin--NADP reductase n=1 Tax=Oceanospirillum maris TaxID=64977 RepID=UPI00041AFBEC|nr:ferredoxin--NADP reductase [Oceanospirillum maris]